jgi:transcriptional regulator with XRE-family HTH domain
MRADLLIRDARHAAGLTQVQLAAALGISQSAIAKLERAGCNPTVETLDRVLRATGHRLQLIAPAWGSAASQAGPSIDVSLVTHQLALTPRERLVALERMHVDGRKIVAAGARARGETGDGAPGGPFFVTNLLRRLVDASVDFVVVGGVAVVVQAMPRWTKQLDICCAANTETLDALAAVLAVQTGDGDVDLRAQPDGCPPYPELRANADRIELDGATVLVASIDDLIAMKRAAGRPQDLIDLEALEIARRRRSK